jgi:hypothetical protein
MNISSTVTSPDDDQNTNSHSVGRAPAFQLYAAEYLADENITLMSLEEEGAYNRARAYCWREGSLPEDDSKLSRLLKGASAETLKTVKACFEINPHDPSRLIHLGLEEQREKQRLWREKSAVGGKRSGKMRRKRGLQGSSAMNHPSTTVEPSCEGCLNTSSSSSSASAFASSSAFAPSDKTRASEKKAPRSGQGARVLSKAPLVLKSHGLSFQKHGDEDAQRVTDAIVKATKITDGWTIRQIMLQAELELKTYPGKVEKVVDEMLSAYQAYCDALKHDSLKKPHTKIEKFFGEGLWRDPGRWGYKAGRQSYCIPVPRAPYPPSSTQ